MYTVSVNEKAAALNPLNSARNRANEVRYKYMTDQVGQGNLDLQPIAGRQQTTRIKIDIAVGSIAKREHGYTGRYYIAPDPSLFRKPHPKRRTDPRYRLDPTGC